MADLTLEEALKIFERIDANGRARDEKGRFIAEKQLAAARELIKKDLESFKGTTGSFKKLLNIQNETKKALEAQLAKQVDTLKANQEKLEEGQNKLKELQNISEEERASDHEEQVAATKEQIAKSEKATKLAEDQVRDRKEQIEPLRKENRLLQERKDELNKMGKALEEQGLDKNEDKAFRKEQQAIQLEEIELRKKGDIPLSKRLELEKEKAKAQAESDNILTKGFGNLKLGIANLAGKFGAGAMAIGKGLLTLFGLGLLIKFLESDVFKRIREFIAGPSLETLKEIFMPGGDLDLFAGGLALAFAVATGILAKLTFKALGGPLLISAIKGVFGLAATSLAKFLPKKTMGPSGEMVSVDGKDKAKEDFKDKTKGKKPGRLGRLFVAVKCIGGTALEKGAQAAKAVGQSAKAIGTKAVDLGKTGLQKGTQLAKQTAQVGTKIGKDAVSGARAVLPKIAGASKAGLKAAGAASKFIPGAGLVIGAGIAAVEGVASGVQEFKESGDAGRAIAEGFGGALSSLTFGLVDKEKFADFFKKEEELTSDQLAQAMAGGGSIAPERFASLAGGSDAARLRQLENEVREGGASRGKLEQMRSLEARLAGQRARESNVTNIVDNSTNSNSNATNNTHMSTPIVDRELDFLANSAF